MGEAARPFAGLHHATECLGRWSWQEELLSTAVAALAAEWRYCLAQDEGARKVFVTHPFQSDSSLQHLEAQFNTWLRASEVISSVDGVSVPARSPLGPEADIRAALDYNRGLGMKAVQVDWAAF